MERSKKENTIISKNCRIRHPKDFSVGEYSVIDDFSYFSTKVSVGRFSHIAAGCTIAGGKDMAFHLGDFSSVSSGARIFCRSNDFVNDLVMLIHPGFDVGFKPIEGDVAVGNMCGVGANTVIMPDNKIPDGTVVGGLSFVPPGYKFRPWSVYAGAPVRLIKKRNKANVLRQAEELERLIKSPKEAR